MVGKGSSSCSMCNARAIERRHRIPMDRHSRAWRGVWSGLTEW